VNPLVLYGPPASGKDVITTELVRQDPAFELYRPLRTGPISDRYRHLAKGAALPARIAFHVVERYGRRYVFDEAEVSRLLAASRTPVLHLGQLDGVQRLQALYPSAIVVQLVCSRDTCQARSAGRADVDLADRLTAWDATAADLARHPDFPFALALDTEALIPAEAAVQIRKVVDA
jgi:guanylate kinase